MKKGGAIFVDTQIKRNQGKEKARCCKMFITYIIGPSRHASLCIGTAVSKDYSRTKHAVLLLVASCVTIVSVIVRTK